MKVNEKSKLTQATTLSRPYFIVRPIAKGSTFCPVLPYLLHDILLEIN